MTKEVSIDAVLNKNEISRLIAHKPVVLHHVNSPTKITLMLSSTISHYDLYDIIHRAEDKLDVHDDECERAV